MKKLVAVILASLTLFLFGCGAKGGLTENYGLKENNITKIEYYYQTGKAPKVIDSSKYGEFMNVFNVEYYYYNGTGTNKNNGYYAITYTGSENKIFIYIQPDGTVVAEQYNGPMGKCYASVSEIEIPYSLQS